MITLGTGIGGSIIIDNKIISGHNFTAGEVGYLRIGGVNWQDLASASALVTSYEKEAQLSGQNGKSFFEDYSNGNPVAEKVLNQYITYVLEGLLNLSYILNPEVIVLGGGILAKADILIPKIKSELLELAIDRRFLPQNILAAQLGNEANRVGAVYRFLESLNE